MNQKHVKRIITLLLGLICLLGFMLLIFNQKNDKENDYITPKDNVKLQNGELDDEEKSEQEEKSEDSVLSQSNAEEEKRAEENDTQSNFEELAEDKKEDASDEQSQIKDENSENVKTDVLKESMDNSTQYGPIRD